jgi:putative membrane protein
MLLNSADHERIAHAVATAEATTRGEIVCVVIDEAAPYAEVPLAWAAIGALVLPLLALAAFAVAAALRHFDVPGGWAAAQVAAPHAAVLTTLTGYAALQCILFMGIFIFVSLTPIRRRLTPPSLKRARVRRRALEQFFASALHKTRERTGVLIFVSLNDRRAEVLADLGISEKVDPSEWEAAIADLVAGIRARRPGDGFVAAIERCGQLLAYHFPAGPDNPNERPDGLVESPQV